MQEFLNVALKQFEHVMPHRLAEIYIQEQLRPMLAIESSVELFIEALTVHRRYKLSWYDSLIVAAALEAKCDVLYTEDLQHGQRFGHLVVTDPFL
jgi:predicted nucleic acid-binding protein